MFRAFWKRIKLVLQKSSICKASTNFQLPGYKKQLTFETSVMTSLVCSGNDFRGQKCNQYFLVTRRHKINSDANIKILTKGVHFSQMDVFGVVPFLSHNSYAHLLYLAAPILATPPSKPLLYQAVPFLAQFEAERPRKCLNLILLLISSIFYQSLKW